MMRKRPVIVVLLIGVAVNVLATAWRPLVTCGTCRGATPPVANNAINQSRSIIQALANEAVEIQQAQPGHRSGPPSRQLETAKACARRAAGRGRLANDSMTPAEQPGGATWRSVWEILEAEKHAFQAAIPSGPAT